MSRGGLRPSSLRRERIRGVGLLLSGGHTVFPWVLDTLPTATTKTRTPPTTGYEHTRAAAMQAFSRVLAPGKKKRPRRQRKKPTAQVGTEAGFF